MLDSWVHPTVIKGFFSLASGGASRSFLWAKSWNKGELPAQIMPTKAARALLDLARGQSTLDTLPSLEVNLQKY